MVRRLLEFIQKRRNPVQFWVSRGLTVGKNCRLVGEVHFGTEPYLISLGDNVSITYSSLITHDGGVWTVRERHPNIDLIAPIKIGNNVFIGWGCLILPGVTIGDNVIVGAGSVVTKNLESNGVYGGNPARLLKTLRDYEAKVETSGLATKHLSKSEKRKYLSSHFGATTNRL